MAQQEQLKAEMDEQRRFCRSSMVNCEPRTRGRRGSDTTWTRSLKPCASRRPKRFGDGPHNEATDQTT